MTRRIEEPKTLYAVFWWMAQMPYVSVFENKVAAEAAANVRNALMVTFSGEDIRIDSVVDWFRRNENGEPMPAEWRDLAGQLRAPWAASKPVI